jgi:hypothetical protein
MSVGEVWPRCSATEILNPPPIFAGYQQAVDDVEHAAHSDDDEKLLTQSWKIFDNESARRTSIDTRAGAIMPAISLAATLVTGAGFTVLKDTALPLNARWVILATLLTALVYLGRTTWQLFRVHGEVHRNTPDPTDLPPPPMPAWVQAEVPSPYDRALACKIMRYTIQNYRINNEQSDELFVAQKAFRNAIFAIAIGGTIAGLMILLAKNEQPNGALSELRKALKNIDQTLQNDKTIATLGDLRKSLDGVAEALKYEKPVLDISELRKSFDKIDGTLDAKFAPAVGAIRQTLEQIEATLRKEKPATDCFDVKFMTGSDPALKALKARTLGSTGQFRALKSYYVPFDTGKSALSGSDEQPITEFLSGSMTDNAPLSIHGVADGQNNKRNERFSFERALAVVKYITQTQPARPIVDLRWSVETERAVIIKVLQTCQ